jgi:hypothetical protein
VSASLGLSGCAASFASGPAEEPARAGFETLSEGLNDEGGIWSFTNGEFGGELGVTYVVLESDSGDGSAEASVIAQRVE